MTGPRLNSAAQLLRAADGIRTVAPFGGSLHVSAHSAARFAAALAQPALAGVSATPIATSLEEVFITLMQGAQDNFERAKK